MPVRWGRVVTTVAAAGLALAAALPAIWWEPLHLDERVMLEFAPDSPGAIVREIFVDRGGAPLQFLVEHVTLDWPGGLIGLRLPSLVFFVLALGWTLPVGRRLVGRGEGSIATLLLAVAPLAVGLATFARMYTLLLWFVLVTAWLSLRAAETDARRDWILAGGFAGALVYAHPIAPLFALPAFCCGIALTDRPLRESLRATRSAIVTAVVVALPYVYALAVLRSRYDVGESGPLATTAGRSVPEEALHALTPGGAVGLVVTSALATAGAVRIAREQRRVAFLLVAWVVIPILFFTAVPAETRFFDRYVLAALPPFLLLTAAGCLIPTRRRLAVGAALTVALLALEIGDDVDRLRTLHDLDLRALPRPLEGQILFSSTGTPRSDRPPELLDDLVLLRWPEAQRLEELPAVDPRFDADVYAHGVRDTRRFVRQDVDDATGIWLFRGSERRVRTAARRFAADPDLAVRRVGPELVVVSSRRSASRRALVELGIRVRETWGTTTPADRWPRTIARIDREALG